MAQETVWSEAGSPSLKTYTISNYKQLPQVQALPEEVRFEMDVVATVLPFKTNNYVVEQLIDWDKVPDDPMYVLTFPQKEMLKPKHFDQVARMINDGTPKEEMDKRINDIRMELNPHPAGQLELNVPSLKDGTKLYGMQHKYDETCLFFPSQSQTCHAYCTFCFRWPQFVGMDDMKFAMREGEQLAEYVREHPEISDVLFTGGDPMIMKAKMFRTYVDTLIDARLPNLTTIRIGTKMLTYWPYKVLTDDDAAETLETFRHISDSGLHLSVMGHFNHPVELGTDAVKSAIRKVRDTGAQIRTQSPLLSHINDDADAWVRMWTEQVRLGCVPYYMFIVRDTGAQHYFGMPLVRAHEIFSSAYRRVSGLARTVKGPSMSATPGKVVVNGTPEIGGKKVFSLRFLQGRNPEWVGRLFYAEYDENAIWLDDLKPAFGDRFFYEDELEARYSGARQLKRD